MLLWPALLALLSVCHAGDPVHFAPGQRNQLSDREVELELILKEELSDVRDARWAFEVDGTVVRTGRFRFEETVKEEGRPTLSVQLPKVEAGLVVDATLIVSYADSAGSHSFSQRLNVVGPDVLSGLRGKLSDVGVAVYDDLGQSHDVLDAEELEYRKLHSLSGVGEIEEGILIFGERTEFAYRQSLSEAAIAATRAGKQVLVLRPSSDGFPLSSLIRETDADEPVRRHFKQVTLGTISNLPSKKDSLDVAYWSRNDGNPGFNLALIRRRLIAVPDNEADWQILSVTGNGKKGGHLMLVGVPIVESWGDASPRLLLRRLFETALTQIKLRRDGRSEKVALRKNSATGSPDEPDPHRED
ncbi:hypothetical protein [Stratiformator vulcanicus]|uniref:hypothetical protein n=1 Tax=Stratiformator vulcanicus TaxID=2527980 RepID=UPI0011A8A1A4|nr:hypothetical protein [Stratiformator vulcanicus]